jgi:hypothetical protein
MDGRTAARIESAVDAAASALFAAAAAYALSAVLAAQTTTALGGALAFAFCFAGLHKIEAVKAPSGASAERAATPLTDLLAEADRSLLERHSKGDELILDDILAEIGPDSRVVRLFDPSAAPTPGQLQARIDRHLDDGTQAAGPPDASQALHDALAELRRSLN